MPSLRLWPYNIIQQIIFYFIIVAALESCNQLTPTVEVIPNHFKIQTPFILDKRGIIINTYWGIEKKHFVLCLDNYSPSWIKSSRIHFTNSFKKSNSVGFKTKTGDGSPIQGDIGICDILNFENIIFKNVPFYVMPDSTDNNKSDNGVLGIDVLSKGIWKINFKREELEFASAIDSFKEINQCEILPSIFDQNSISIEVNFGSDNIKNMPIDLGYNGDMILPSNEFKPIMKSRQTFSNAGMFTTPAQQNFVNSLYVFDTVKIDNNYFITQLTSNEKVKERSIGLSFFKRFDYVIFDFINKHVYIPKKVW